MVSKTILIQTGISGNKHKLINDPQLFNEIPRLSIYTMFYKLITSRVLIRNTWWWYNWRGIRPFMSLFVSATGDKEFPLELLSILFLIRFISDITLFQPVGHTWCVLQYAWRLLKICFMSAVLKSNFQLFPHDYRVLIGLSVLHTFLTFNWREFDKLHDIMQH